MLSRRHSENHYVQYHKNVRTAVLACMICHAHVYESEICSYFTCSAKCLTEILFSTFVTSKDINQGFFHAVKFVIDFVSSSCNCHGKTARLINICTNLVTWSFTIKISYCPVDWIQIQLSSNQVATYLPRFTERDHRTWFIKVF